MKLTMNTFNYMIKNIRAIYGSNWRSDLNNDEEAQLIFFTNCQELIAEELVDEFICVYRTHREYGPRSPYDLVATYIDKQLENAKSSDFVIDKLIDAIRDYNINSDKSQFSTCEKYLFANVIPMLPCPDGVKSFYLHNKNTLFRIAEHKTSDEDNMTLYRNMRFDYRKQLVDTERKAVIEQISRVSLPTRKQNEQLEA